MMSSSDPIAQLTPEQQRALLAELLRKRASQPAAGATQPGLSNRGEPAEPSRFAMALGQQGLWYAYCRDPHATPFNVFLPSRIRSSVNIDALRGSIDMLAQRHSCLRTTFANQAGDAFQIVHPSLPPEFQVIDATHLSHPAQIDALRNLIAVESQRPFNLEQGPLLRMAVYRLGEQDWIVLATTHHIVVDFWSLILILSELREIYPSLAQGQPLRLSPASNNYREFVEEQRAILEGSRGQQLEHYWLKQLEGCPTVLDLVTDYPRPSAFTGRAAIRPLDLPSELSHSVQQLAGRLRVTPFAIVHAALQVMLCRYSGQREFLIGSPFSGRGHRKFETTVGFFVNMLPLRANLSGQPNFVELVHRTQHTLLEALEHEAFPFSAIVRAAAPARDPSRSPLFQVSCTFEKSQLKSEMGRAGFLFPEEQEVANIGGLHQESFYIPQQTCHYDLEFIFEQTADGLRGMICYCCDLFSSQTASALATAYGRGLSELMKTPERSVFRSDRRLGDDQRSPDRPSTFTTVDRMLAETCAAHEASPALRHGEKVWSYQQLRSAIAGVIPLLEGYRSATPASEGLEQIVVPVMGVSGPESLIAILGVMAAGAAVVPIDSNQPAMQRQALIDDTCAPIVLEPPLEIRPSSCEWGSASRPQDLAYIIYTSGSTGKPKGVMIEHRSICNTLLWRRRAVPLTPSDRVLMLLSHQFDAGLGIALTTLTQGAELVWADPHARHDLSRLIDQLLRDRITVLPAIPSLLQMLVEHPRFGECTELRQLWTGGETMPRELPELVRQRCRAELWNFYGPTEAAVEATANCVNAHDRRRSVPLGAAIDNTAVFIIDEELQPVADAFPGQLAIAGEGLARGYLGSSLLTAERFVKLPTSQGDTLRVYLTGDRGRRLADGQIEFLGRLDHQIKLRGYRIELEEIEQQLASHRWVDRAAVKLQGDDAKQMQLVAYLCLKPDAKLSVRLTSSQVVAEIRRELANRLPAYKLPAQMVILDSLPMTSSGKVDRKRLPLVQSQVVARPETLPDTPLERYLATAWCTALGLPEISVDQNFFELGGSSLQAAMLTAKLSEDLGLHVPTSLLFDLADISQVAQRLVQLYEVQIAERFGMASVTAYATCSHASGYVNHALGGLHPLLAPLKTDGTRTPMFLVHPPGGIVLCYRELANRLAADQRLYAIRSRGLHGHEQLPGSIEEAAADYLRAVQSIQPHGPYLFGGWSLGGIFAYEMAQQAMAMGETVERLILIDTTVPERAEASLPVADRVNVGAEYGIDLSLDQLVGLHPDDQLPLLWQHAKNLGVLQDETPAEVVQQVLGDLKRLFHHHMELTTRYEIRNYPGTVRLIRPKDAPIKVATSEDRGWRHLARDVEVRFVSGHHHSMVQVPHVADLAQAII